MKNLLKLLCAFVMLATSIHAQEEETNNPVATDESLQIAGQTDQERIEFLMQVAMVYFEEGDIAPAVQAFERVLEIDPKHKQARMVLSQVYISAKKSKEAVQLLRALVEEFPDDFQIKNNLAWFYATTQDPAFRDGEKAVELAQEAMVLAPNSYNIWSTLAEAYYVTGQYEKAYRAIKHMAALVSRYGTGVTEDMVKGYNEQILKCKRAWESEQTLKKDSGTETTNAPAAEEWQPILQIRSRN